LQLAITVTAIVFVSAVIVFVLGYVIDKNTEA